MPIPAEQLEVALRAVIAQPGHPRYPEVAEALVAAGRFAEAIEVAEQGLAVLPKPEGQIVLADANLQLGRTDHAQAMIERVLASMPASSSALRILGECHLRTGRPDLASPLLRQAAEGNPPDARARQLFDSLGPQAAPPAAPAPPAGPGVEDASTADWGGGSIELETGPPPTPGALAPGGFEEDAPLELDLGGPPLDTELPPGGAGQPGFDPLPQHGMPPVNSPRPPSDPMMAAAGSRRPASGSRLQPYAPPHLAKERRQKTVGILAAVVLLAGGGGGTFLWQQNQKQKVAEAVAAAEAACAQDTAVALAAAEASVQEALALSPEDPEALGLGAFVAVRRYTAFEAATDTLITAQERIGTAVVQAQVAHRTRVAQAMILVEQKRYGEVVEVISSALANAPGDAGLLWVRAQAEWGLERLPLALESMARAHASDPNFLPLVPTFAEALQAAGRGDEATDVLSATVDAHPEHLKSVIRLLEYGARQKDRRAALLQRATALEQPLRTSATPTELCEFNLAAARLALASGDAERTRSFENGASSAEADAGCREALGQALLARERPCAAADVLAGAAEALAAEEGERATRARLQAANAALRCGRTSRAAGLANRLEAGPERTLLEVRLEAADGRLTEARKKLEPLLKDRKSASRAWAVAARIAIGEDNLDDARKAAMRASQRMGKDLDHRLEVARVLLATGEAPRAASVVGVPKKRESPSYARLALRGEALSLASSRSGPGLSELEQAIEMNPDAESAIAPYLATAPEARRSRFAERLGPAQAAGLELRALLQEGNLKAAATLLEAYPAAKGEPLRLSLGRALLAILDGSSGRIDRLKELALANKHLSEAQTDYAIGLHRLGKLADAVTAYETAIALAPGRVEARVGKAEALVDGATNPDEAMVGASATLAWVTRLVSTDRQLARAHAAVAIARAELTDKAGAKKALDQASRLAGDDPRVRYAAGRVTEAAGDIPRAVKIYQGAALEPGGELALLRLGAMGADGVAPAAAAREALERFLEIQPGHAQASRAKQLLSALR